MSNRKPVSPLLDGFLMGEPISDHDGVRCCPAMAENSDDKYIVKIISIPSSQRQLDALLLTGAYPDAASATAYFKIQADGVEKEAEILRELSKLQGFVPYEGWQTVPMESGQLGYEVCLLAPYRRSLEKYLKRNTMTHLGAVNLGLDLCAALSICRRAGYMFVDLKPSNIFRISDREYRIGDLGFTAIDALKFNSLPSKYRSPYTAPELHDDLSTLNPTADIYGVGMILYQIYNDGRLPFETAAPSTALPCPSNADYEMGEIILKAIDPNPRKRWQTPIEMGQALVSYMQRNRVNDVPIVPPALDHDAVGTIAQEPAELESREQTHAELAFMQAISNDETAPDTGDGLISGKTSDEVNDMLAQADELLAMKLPGQVVVPEAPELVLPPVEEPVQLEEPEAPVPVQASEESVQPQEPEDPKPEEPLRIHKQEQPEQRKSASPESPRPRKKPAARRDIPGEDEDLIETRKPGITRTLVTIFLLIQLLALAVFGVYWFYTNYYLLPIDGMQIDGREDSISVFLRTDVDETMLIVVCTDPYGNSFTTPVVNGQAEFIGLTPGTMYKITVEVEGFHALSGVEPCQYITPEQTKLSGFTAKTGTEDGSVVLSFTAEGKQTQDWTVEYSAEDEEVKSVSFTGNSVTISGLSVGKVYTFQLVASAEELWLVGSSTLKYEASKILMAEDLTITGCVDGILTAQWTAPPDIAVDIWTVRCYNDSGYDETIVTSDTAAVFQDIEPNRAYTVEVTADGMTKGATAFVTPNPATVTKLNVEAPANQQVLNISWEFTGSAPEGGWLVLYSIDGSSSHGVVLSQEPSAVIEGRIPGATYDISIQAADGSTVFQGSTSYTCLDTDSFEAHAVKASTVTASLCPTPEKSGWTYEDVDSKAYTSKYAPGDRVSMVIYNADRPDASTASYEVLFVIRDESGAVMMDLLHHATYAWNQLWANRSRYCELDIPAIPNEPGQYTVEVYFGGRLLVEKNMTIQTEE